MQKQEQHSPKLRTLPLFIFSKMDSSDQNPELLNNPNSVTDQDYEGRPVFSGILEVFVHHARNIHNICIYENQDVYAKFVLTNNPDEVLSTRLVVRGGKNPDFNESISLRIGYPEAILKCEIWMLSRARNYMEDQLLGFALVPISSVVGKGKVTQDFSLSSTDLFHSPAGTVKLSLSLNTSPPTNSFPVSHNNSSSISSEVVLVDRSIQTIVTDPIEYTSIEFPDIDAVQENHKMVSEYFHLASESSDPKHDLVSTASFLCLGASSQPSEDSEMALNPDVSMQNCGSSNDDKNSLRRTVCDKDSLVAEIPCSSDHLPLENYKNNNDEGKEHNYIKIDTPFSALNVKNNEAEQSAMQKQIVDMYMRSMHQFTDSLAKMELPMNLGKAEVEARGESSQDSSSNKMENNKKDGSRVFYGSRAFF